MAMRYIKVYYDWLDAIQPLSDGERGRLLTALLEYARDGELITLNGGERYVFPYLKAQIDRDRQSYEDISQKRSAVGAMGGRPRADEKQTKANKAIAFSEKQTKAKQSNCFQDKDQDQDQDKDQDKDEDEDRTLVLRTRECVYEEDTTPTSPPNAADAMFDRFWSAYPRKQGKDAARKAFAHRKPDKALLHTMLSAIAAQKNSDQWRRDGGQYIPNPATWLNQGRWQDEGTSSNSGFVVEDDAFAEYGGLL